MHITTHIHHPCRLKRQQLSQKPLITPFPRRINHNHALIPIPILLLRFRENIGCVPGRESGVGYGVEGGVEGCGGDGGGGDVDAEGGGEEGRESYGEEAGAGVGVYEVFDRFLGFAGGGSGGFWGERREDVGANIGSESFEDGVVVLEEGAGRVEEGVGANMLG